MVNKNNSFDNQRMLAYGVRATRTTALRHRATESVFAISSHFRNKIDITNNITEHPTRIYHRPVSARLKRSVTSTFVSTQRMLDPKSQLTILPPRRYATKPHKGRHLLPYS